jgi:hypothetical protein
MPETFSNVFWRRSGLFVLSPRVFTRLSPSLFAGDPFLQHDEFRLFCPECFSDSVRTPAKTGQHRFTTSAIRRICRNLPDSPAEHNGNRSVLPNGRFVSESISSHQYCETRNQSWSAR